MKIGNALTTVILLLLSIVLLSSPAWSLPGRCYSQKFDIAIAEAVDERWNDFPIARFWKAQLCQESQLDPEAVSPVGAMGLAQIMPATYAEIIQQLKWESRITAFDPTRAISAGAYYQGNTRRFWSLKGRTPEERNRFGAAGYNAGNGNIVKAQKACGGSLIWAEVAPCLKLVTGRYAAETLTYVSRIYQYAEELKR